MKKLNLVITALAFLAVIIVMFTRSTHSTLRADGGGLVPPAHPTHLVHSRAVGEAAAVMMHAGAAADRSFVHAAAAAVRAPLRMLAVAKKRRGPDHPSPAQQEQSRLTVGLWDDNANYDAFDEFSRSLRSAAPTAPGQTSGLTHGPFPSGFPLVDHRDRVRVVVRDAVSGLPVPGAHVSVRVAREPVSHNVTLRSGSGGIVTVLPRALFPSLREGDALVVSAGDATVTLPLQRDHDVVHQPVPLAANVSSLHPFSQDSTPSASHRPANAVSGIDVAIILDTTGSMADELRFITSELVNIARGVVRQHPNIRLRFAVVLYRDIGDDYVVKGLDFSPSVEQLATRLTAENAAGGGDFPEAAEQALHFANDQLSWSPSPSTLRLAFWIADAPHHDENAAAMATAIVNASLKGIRLYPIAGSGANDLLEFTMRTAALATSGRYLFLTDHSGIGDSHKEPRIPCYFVTHLKSAMERCIAMELTGEFVQPAAADVIATVGDVQNRRCQTRSGRTVVVT